MKSFIRALIGGIVGFGSAYAILHFKDMNQSEYIFVYGGLAVIAFLLVFSVKLYQEVKRLYNTSFSGDEEDEADKKKYQKTSDFSMYSNIAMVLSMIVVAVTFIQTLSISLKVAASIVFALSLIVVSLTSKISKYLYPDRELPKADATTSGDEYLDKMIDLTDEGERFVILQGLYKSNYLMNALLITAIVFTTVYSAVQESSQLFSIIIMGVILIAGNVKYQRVIRNK